MMDTHPWQSVIWEVTVDAGGYSHFDCVDVSDGRGGYWRRETEGENPCIIWVEETWEEHKAHGGGERFEKPWAALTTTMPSLILG
mgnify:FL=1